MLIGGIIVLVVGVILYFVAKGQANKAHDIQATPTSTASELETLSKQVAGEIGAGSFNQIAEVKGTVVCDQPLTAEMSATSCVHYSCTVTREYEERVWDTDSNGNRYQKTVRGSEQVSHNARSVPFYVEDASGKILVDPEGASFETEKTFSQYQVGSPQNRVSFGSFSFDLGVLNLGTGRQTLGYRFEEKAIPVGRPIYVLGEAVDAGGLKIQKPANKGRFIVSLKSEETLVASAKTAAMWLNVATGVLAAGGVGLIVAAIVRF